MRRLLLFILTAVIYLSVIPAVAAKRAPFISFHVKISQGTPFIPNKCFLVSSADSLFTHYDTTDEEPFFPYWNASDRFDAGCTIHRYTDWFDSHYLRIIMYSAGDSLSSNAFKLSGPNAVAGVLISGRDVEVKEYLSSKYPGVFSIVKCLLIFVLLKTLLLSFLFLSAIERIRTCLYLLGLSLIAFTILFAGALVTNNIIIILMIGLPVSVVLEYWLLRCYVFPASSVAYTLFSVIFSTVPAFIVCALYMIFSSFVG